MRMCVFYMVIYSSEHTFGVKVTRVGKPVRIKFSNNDMED